ncbi:hypothetical protein Ab1vBOLIVR5_gp234 [Agrobacterium phage OLIVR5]|uniref:Uncharacterized protein n=1 Tax=Agrobacterium phage OLIVR5 TaxID=2723773 RepID=A0A858MT28_9CAUD|nr:hypothetical protein KNU99_gp167 [Agrobacterium phage OLIVR5]QIW87882.1 hypothetical protein Ab1vBOLIVR5_gp234 [Agrobacterium phage OLIVR5]QIW88147.1 hypothetical protein Ab1vBOLIVR6_gp240 [Agrobacterium phage OLIVR6]
MLSFSFSNGAEMEESIFEEDEDVRVIINAGRVPDGWRVTKLKGTKEYRIVKTIKVWNENKVQQKIEGLFIIDGSANINSIDPDTEVVMILHPYNLLQIMGEV